MKTHKDARLTPSYKIKGTGPYARCSFKKVEKVSRNWDKVTCKQCLKYQVVKLEPEEYFG